jgi:CRISPR/Cas system type I-B associated protein Csh2 (Cas7 group RAMP superfamily)
MSEPTIEEQLAIVTNSRNALLLSNDQLFKENQKALADHAKALADQATKNQAAITKLEQDHATVLATKATELASVQSSLSVKTSQLESVTQAKTQLDLQVATLTTEKQTLTSDISSLRNSLAGHEASDKILQETVVVLTNEKAELTARVVDLTERLEAGDRAMDTLESIHARELSALQAKVTDLEQYRPYNPRWLDGRAFYKRISQQDMETLLASDNPQLVFVGKTVLAYRDNHVQWPVILDSDDFKNLVGIVFQSGVFDEAEVTEAMRDATREEAYRVPE